MVIGNSRLLANKPIFAIFEKGLDRSSSYYWNNVTQVSKYLYGIQVSGYAVWLTALNIKDRNAEVSNVQDVARTRLAQQKTVMDTLTQSESFHFFSIT